MSRKIKRLGERKKGEEEENEKRVSCKMRLSNTEKTVWHNTGTQ